MGSRSDKVANAAEIDRLALAVAKEPGSKAFIPLAEEYSKAGMWKEAAAVLEDGLKFYPNFITAMVALGRAYDQLNQPVKAIAILEEAVKLSPENLRAHRTLAKIYAAQNNKDAAVRSCRVILAANPQDQEALALLSMLGVPFAQAVKRSIRQHSIDSLPSKSNADPALDQSKERLPIDANQKSYEASTDNAPQFSPQKSEIVLQLERWLASIQSRRRTGGLQGSRRK